MWKDRTSRSGESLSQQLIAGIDSIPDSLHLAAGSKFGTNVPDRSKADQVTDIPRKADFERKNLQTTSQQEAADIQDSNPKPQPLAAQSAY